MVTNGLNIVLKDLACEILFLFLQMSAENWRHFRSRTGWYRSELLPILRCCSCKNHSRHRCHSLSGGWQNPRELVQNFEGNFCRDRCYNSVEANSRQISRLVRRSLKKESVLWRHWNCITLNTDDVILQQKKTYTVLLNPIVCTRDWLVDIWGWLSRCPTFSDEFDCHTSVEIWR